MGDVDTAILSCHLQAMFDWLASPTLNKFQSRHGVDEDLKKLRSNMLKLQDVLNDAEQKQRRISRVKEWLDDFNHLVYDAEDILDLYATQVGRWSQVFNSSDASSSSSTNINEMKKKFDIQSPLKEIVEKAEELSKQTDVLRLEAGVVGRPTTEIERRGRETSSLVDESRVYGRESDKEKIIELLLSDGSSRGDEVAVIPIVGMGGLGKTTLAQLVYNDKRVVRHFHPKAWVCVSEEVDVRRITRAILELVTKKHCNLEYLDLLQVELKGELSGKRFLIVLDDIWNENPKDWEDLRIPFRFGKQGSKIIVTTRSEKVSRIMGTTSAFSLGVLEKEECSSLFWKYVTVDNKYLTTHPNLKAIGDEIVGKCKGLPLAIKALAGLLRFRVEEDEWKDILKTEFWDIPEGDNIILPILRLSYQYLPPHLKQCFSYCSIFPKDYKFDKEELVWMWMAEGFVSFSERKQMEDIGSRYFDDLFSRSFFQYYCDDYGMLHVVMHDLVHDLARSISKETCIGLDGDKLKHFSEKARYFSLVCVRDQPVEFDSFYNGMRLRTFLLRFPYFNDDVIQKWPNDLFSEWKCLHVLSLHHHRIAELPDSIGNLVLLRYLNLYGTCISKLPESVCTLYNLQTLILGYGFVQLRGDYISGLPKGLHNLINLRHIKMRKWFGLMGMPREIGKLIGLQTLSDFVVGKSNESARLGELKDLIHLRGQLHILGLQNVVDVMDAKEANLENKRHLYKLTLDWTDVWDIDLGEEKGVDVEEIIECLQPNKNLKELSIKYYPGIRFPSWITVLSSLVYLELYNCEGNVFKSRKRPDWEERSSRPEEGQEEEEGKLLFPHLAYLKIYRCRKLTRLPFYQLPSLVKLEIFVCAELTTLSRLRIPLHGSSGEEFPCLRKLQINSCQKLWQLPDLLSSLEDLHIQGCPKLCALPMLPLLRSLYLAGCDGKTLFTRVGPLPSLSKLYISNIRWFNCLMEEFLQPLTSLEELTIYNCKDLKAFGSEVVGLHHLTSLQRVEIHGCDELTLSFPEEEGFPIKLQFLELSPLNKLEKLPQLHNLTFLVELVIRMAPRLTSFPETGLPPKLRRLKIGQCMKLESLPKGLRNLTCLEELEIDRCLCLTSLTEIEDKEGGLFPPTLKTLRIEGCRNLKELSRLEWIHHNLASLGDSTTKGCCTSTALKEIWISKCKSLESLPKGLHNLTCLEELEIESCPVLASFTVAENEEGGLFPPSLKHLYIKGCENLKEVSRREWIYHNLTSLRDSTTKGCCITTALKEIWISGCMKLESLPKGLCNLTSLKKLKIDNCPSLTSLTVAEDEEGGLFPPTLKSLQIEDCRNLKELSKHEWIHHNLTSLRDTSMKGRHTTIALKKIWFIDCMSLESLPKGLCNLTCLEELKIDRCPSLTSFTAIEDEEGGLFPPALISLCIKGCGNLKELSRHEWIHRNLTFLEDSKRKGYHTTTALKEIWIEECMNLESLPSQMQNLTSLENLRIVRCPRLVIFSEGGLPTNLIFLEISGCGDYLDSLPKRAGLHRLSSLETLTISWCSGMVSFPKEEDEKEWQLPRTLRKLSFEHFESLEFFRPKWLYNLCSLDTLEISHASKLTDLPEEGPPTTLKELCFYHLESLNFLRGKWLHNLTSLQKLYILNAPKLVSLPEEGLPATLRYLQIGNCLLLMESCLKERGRDWPKIAHIPYIDIY